MEAARNFMPLESVNVVVYHSPCNDGHSAAAVFHHARNDIEFYGAHPNDDAFPKELNLQGKNVIMVDIAFSAETLQKASQLAKSVLILDHHITNKTTLETLSIPNIHCVFVMGIAGVHLAWKFVYYDAPIPRSLNYIGLKDVWKHEQDENALYFTTAFERPKTFEDWYPVIQDVETNRIIEMGRTIFNYQQSVLKTMMEKVRYTRWRGYRMAIVNVPFPWIGDIGAMMCQDEPENTIAVVWNKAVDEPFSVSLRTHNLLGPNVEIIAKEFNGGGHVHGAGLRLERPPYEIFNE